MNNKRNFTSSDDALILQQPASGIGLKTLEKLQRASRGTLLRRAAELGVSMAFNDAHDEPVDTRAVRRRDKLVDPLLERLMHVHCNRK
jgi:hypothetical protein